mgnify:CR=1 FL=1
MPLGCFGWDENRMRIAVFSLRSILPRFQLGTPKVFRIFGGCGTRPDGLVGAQTSSPSRYCPPAADIWIPENPKAALAKIDIRCENRNSHSINIAVINRDSDRFIGGMNISMYKKSGLERGRKT